VSLPLINEHCTYQDEELALCLMDAVDNFKNDDGEYSEDDEEYQPPPRRGGAGRTREQEWRRELSEAAFQVDDNISYNI
jgi:hypothetical protein